MPDKDRSADSSRLTSEIVGRVRDGKQHERFFSKVEELVRPHLLPPSLDRIAFWNHVAFLNYIPVVVGSTHVPFYFTPFTPMLLNIKTGYHGVTQRPMDDIVILCSSLRTLGDRSVPFVFSDRHAYLALAEFSTSLQDLDRIDWPLLRSRDFSRDPDDPGKMDRYQAEALVHRRFGCDLLSGILCHSVVRSQKVEELVAEAGLEISVHARPSMYL